MPRPPTYVKVVETSMVVWCVRAYPYLRIRSSNYLPRYIIDIRNRIRIQDSRNGRLRQSHTTLVLVLAIPILANIRELWYRILLLLRRSCPHPPSLSMYVGRYRSFQCFLFTSSPSYFRVASSQPLVSTLGGLMLITRSEPRSPIPPQSLLLPGG